MAFRPPLGRVLIADRNVADVQSAGNHLTDAGYEVYVATDVQNAIELAQRSIPDVILLDLTLNSVTGTHLSRRFHDLLSPLSTPIIFLITRREDVERGFNDGGADVVRKPFVPVALVARVRTQVTLGRQHRRLQGIADQDPTTGLANREHFDSYLKLEWQRNRHSRLPLSVAAAQIDDLDRYRRSNGQRASEVLLERVGKTLEKTCCRNDDLVAYYAPDELTLLLPNTDLDSTQVVAQRVRQSVDSMPASGLVIPSDGFGISLGICTLWDEPGISPQHLLSVARDRVVEARGKGGRTAVYGGVLT